MLINWGAVRPQGGSTPGQEVASITGLLSALAERRVRAEQAAAQQAMAERQFQAQEANRQEDNRRANEDLRLRSQYNDRSLAEQAANHRLLRTQQSTARAAELAAKAHAAGASGDTQGEQMYAELAKQAYAEAGAGEAPAPAQPPAPAPQPQPYSPTAAPQPVEPPPFVPQSPGVFPGAQVPSATPPGGAPGMPGLSPAGPANAPAAQPAAPAPPRLPATRTLDYTPVDRQALITGALRQFDTAMSSVAGRSAFHKRAFDEARAKLASGAYNLKQASDDFTKIVARLEGEEGKNQRTASTNAVRAAGQPLPDKKAMDLEGKYGQEVGRVLSLKKYGDVVKNDRKLFELAKAASGGVDNPALASIVKGAFVKYAQGGTGVVSDQDMKVFWDRMGGLGVRTLQAFEDIMSGNLTDPKRKMVEAAVQQMIAASNKNMDDMGYTIVATLHNLPGGDQRIPRFLKGLAPAYYAKWLAARAKHGPAADDGAVPQTDDSFLQEPPQ